MSSTLRDNLDSIADTAAKYRMSTLMVTELILTKMRTGNAAERELCVHISSTSDFVSRVGLDFDCTGGLAVAAAHKLYFSKVIASLGRRSGVMPKLPDEKQVLAYALVAATYENDTEAVESLPIRGADPGVYTILFGDALSAAASLGNLEIAHMLLIRPMKKNRRFSERTIRRALNKAARSGDCATVQLLLRHNPESLYKPGVYWQTMMMAIQGGHLLVADTLHTEHSQDGRRPGFSRRAFRLAAQSGNEYIMRLILQYPKSDPKFELHDIMIEDACRSGSVEVTNLLFSTRIPHLPLFGGRFWAARSGNRRLIDLTLSEITNPDACAYADALAGAFSAGDDSAVSYIFDVIVKRATGSVDRPSSHGPIGDFNDAIRLLRSLMPIPATTRMIEDSITLDPNANEDYESLVELFRPLIEQGNICEVFSFLPKLVELDHNGQNGLLHGLRKHACMYDRPGIFLLLGMPHPTSLVQLSFETRITAIFQLLLDMGWDINERNEMGEL